MINEIKDLVAQKHGYKNFQDLFTNKIMLANPQGTINNMEPIIEDICKTYHKAMLFLEEKP